MARFGKFEVDMLVDDVPVAEYATVPGAPQAGAWIEPNFLARSSFSMDGDDRDGPVRRRICAALARGPVRATPNEASVKNGWFEVHIAGSKAIAKPLNPGQTRDVAGFQARPGHAGGEERQLLFTRPRLLRRGEATDGYVGPSPSLTPRRVLSDAPVSRSPCVSCDHRLSSHRFVFGRRADPALKDELSNTRVIFYPAAVREEKAHHAATGGASAVVDGASKLAGKKAMIGAASRSGDVILKSRTAVNATY